MDEITRIGGSPPAGDNQRPAPGSGDQVDFRRVLEQLEKLSKPSGAPVPGTASELEDAIKRADHDFSSAMDLRRKLEEAYRRRMA